MAWMASSAVLQVPPLEENAEKKTDAMNKRTQTTNYIKSTTTR